MKKVLFIFFLIPLFLFSQQAKIDSLQNLIKKAKKDTNKVNLLETIELLRNKFLEVKNLNFEIKTHTF